MLMSEAPESESVFAELSSSSSSSPCSKGGIELPRKIESVRVCLIFPSLHFPPYLRIIIKISTAWSTREPGSIVFTLDIDRTSSPSFPFAEDSGQNVDRLYVLVIAPQSKPNLRPLGSSFQDLAISSFRRQALVRLLSLFHNDVQILP